MLDEVIRLRNRGLSVFPVSLETKTPCVKWDRLQDTLPTYEEVKEWFGKEKRAVGVAMGRVSGTFLLDFDFAKHPESRVWYEANRHRLPRTWTERTKSDGLHLYLKWVPALEAKQTNTTGATGGSKLPKGVDTKGYGGYAKMAPSEGYRWIVAPHMAPLANPPDWLLDLLPAKGGSFRKNNNTEASGDWISEALAGLKDGNRDATFTSIAGSLRAHGYTPDAIFSILKGHADKLENGELDLARICKSVGRYPAGAGSTFEANDLQPAAGIESFLENMEIVSWIVPGIVAQKSIGFVAGLSETGKTWILIDLAVEAARRDIGGSWLGRFPVQKPARVLFVDQERFKGETQRRFRAVMAAKGLEAKDLKGNLFIKCGTTTRINLDESFQAFRKELGDIRPDLVIIDSFVAFHTVEENNRGEIQTVLERVKKLRNEFGCTFIFIDHENKGVFHDKDKDKDEQPSAFRMAGSIAKPAAAEFVLTVRRHDPDTSMCYHTKSTLASTVAPFMVKISDIGSKDKIKVEAF